MNTNYILAELPESSVAFKIEALGISVQWYAVLMALGIIIAVVLGCVEVKRKGMHSDTMFDLGVWVVPLGLIGARVYYILFNLDYYLSDPITML